jgi:protein TonB
MKIDGDEMTARLVPSRLPVSLLASATLHALAFVLAVRFVGSIAMPVELPRAEILPVSLVSRPGGGGGDKGNGTPAAPPPAPIASPAPPVPAVPPKPVRPETVAKKRPPAKPRAQPEPPPVAAPDAPTAAAAGAPSATSGDGGARGVPGGGDGSGGDGSGGARPAYGSNPRPPYPLAARRLGIEGRVLLEVVVRSDGSPATVSVRQSSGYQMLDDSAADTVRSRWRFIPARRDGVPVESTVTVPIRFRISEG